MPKKKGGAGKLRSQLEKLLSGLGLGGEFTFLIQKAIQEGWEPGSIELETALRHSGQFRRKFPGMFRGGDVVPFLSSTNNLGEAIRNYNELTQSYQDVASAYGKRWSRKQTALAIRFEKSPDELGTDYEVLRRVRENPGLMDALNEQLRQFGQKPLDDFTFKKFLKGMGKKNYYDIYEAAQLRGFGLNISPEAAKEVARNIGAAGTLTDIASLVKQVRLLKPDIGPELDRAGISDADLVQMEAGTDPRGLEPTVRQILAQRRATGSFVPGYQPRRGTAGGLALFEPEEGTAD